MTKKLLLFSLMISNVVSLMATVSTGTYTVRFKAQGAASYADQIYVYASTEAADSYEMGYDLVKMRSEDPATSPLLWVDAYGVELSVNRAKLKGNYAEFNLTLYAPVAGTYTLYLSQAVTDGSVLQLLQNNTYLADMTTSGYNVTLSVGEVKTYKLIIDASHVAPSTKEICFNYSALQVTGDIGDQVVVRTEAGVQTACYTLTSTYQEFDLSSFSAGRYVVVFDGKEYDIDVK